MAASARVTLVLPRMLEPVVGRTRLELEGRTIIEVLEAAFERSPVLRHHLIDATGSLRGHILCLVDGVAVERRDVGRRRLVDGDELVLVQAISGG